MRTPSKRRGLAGLALLGLAALVAAACAPVAPAPPSPEVTTTTTAPAPYLPACSAGSEPTPAQPVEYVAVVDDPGPSAPDVVTFTATSEADKDAQLADLADQGTVVAVEPEQPVSALAVNPGNDPRYTEQWGLSASGFPTAWSGAIEGTGMRIAVIDTGVQADHEDLAGKVVEGIDFYAGNESSPAGNSDYGRVDFNGHGTHVAGIAGGADNTIGGLGGAPGAMIVPARVLSPSGSGWNSDVVAAINWAADPAKGNADVINLSLGGGSCDSAMQAAVDYANSQGTVVVAAAGNSGNSTPHYPAGANGVIAVGATTSTNARASYSNYGSYVDIGAPGGSGSSSSTSILSTYTPAPSAYTTLNGTSMASPFVAAAAALVAQRCPGITPAQVLSRLQSTASPAVSGFNAGVVQAGAATTACP